MDWWQNRLVTGRYASRQTTTPNLQNAIRSALDCALIGRLDSKSRGSIERSLLVRCERTRAMRNCVRLARRIHCGCRKSLQARDWQLRRDALSNFRPGDTRTSHRDQLGVVELERCNGNGIEIHKSPLGVIVRCTQNQREKHFERPRTQGMGSCCIRRAKQYDFAKRPTKHHSIENRSGRAADHVAYDIARDTVALQK